MVNYKLCAFADEADKALSGQIRAMQENGIAYLEMRGVNGVNVAKLTTAEAKAAAAELKAAGIQVWSLGSPAGKTPITDPFDFEKEQFKRLLETADITGAHAIRLFSFYGTDGKAEYRDEVMERLSRFVEMAKGSGVVLCHENEKGIYGDIASRCLEIHQAVPELKGVFDPANFVQCGQDTVEAWELLEPYIYYGHIKDANKEGKVVPPGQGEGQLPAYLKRFFAKGCQVLTLEPHLTKFVGLAALEGDDVTQSVASWNFSNNREAFDFATNTLKKMLEEL
ncbi:MAG: sugar phosphate isomerase/epimerase [Clostridia bacterium]|nr:sugar phosphate isomerase/epimerase [Clostridia bacterium]